MECQESSLNPAPTPFLTGSVPPDRLTAAVRATAVILWALALLALSTMAPAIGPQVPAADLPGAVVLGFLLAGAGLRSAAAGRTVPAVALGVLVAVCGPLVLLEHHVFDGEWSLHHGPCTVTRALCLLLSGAAIALVDHRTRFKGAVYCGFLGAATAALSLGELSGFVIEKTIAGSDEATFFMLWNFGGLAVLGTGTVSLASRQARHELRARAPRWLAIAVATFLAAGALGLWQSTRALEGQRLEGLVAREIATVAARIEERLDRHVLALERMGGRWEQEGGTPRGAWEVDAANYLLHEPGYQSIAWADPTLTVRWAVPAAWGEKPGAGLAGDERLSSALQMALKTGEPVLSAPVELSAGVIGFLQLVPVHVGGRLDGLIVGELRADRLLEPILEACSALGLGGSVLDGGMTVAGAPAGVRIEERWMRETTIRPGGRRWRIRMGPASRLVHEELTALPAVTLAVSLAIACLVGFSIDRSGIARYRERKFRAFLEAAPHAWVTVDADGRIVQVNSTSERLFGFRRDELVGEPVEALVPEAARAAHPEFRRTYVRDPRPRPMGAGRILHARRKDGGEVPVEISLSPVATDEGLLVLTALIDVTHRIEMDRKLRSMNEDLERQVADRTEALEQRARELERANAELERFNRLAVGREHRMIALKREVNELALRLENEPQYDLSFLSEE